MTCTIYILAPDTFEWTGYFRERAGNSLMKGYQILKKYGWSFDSEEEEQILKGEHELYLKKEERS